MSNVKSDKKNKLKTRAPRPPGERVHSANPPPHRPGLYRFVYASTLSSVFTLLLLCSLFFQGVSVVFANEASAETQEVSNPPSTIETDSSSEIPNDTEEVMVPDGVVDVPLPTPVEVIDQSASPEASVVVEESMSDSEPIRETTMTTSEIATTSATTEQEDMSASSSIDTKVDDEGFTESLEDVETTSNTESEAAVERTEVTPPSVSEDEEDESLGTTTVAETASELPPEGPLLAEPVTTTYSDSGYMFSDGQCTKLATGSFYCHEMSPETLRDALFAAPDEDGDMEIFLVRDGVQSQITMNLVDDAAPFYDQNSETIVWHRSVDDRYQIMVYDLETGEETQLTGDSTNNMEPNRQGKYLAWQRWIDTNWDIILFDGERETRLTRTTAHDLAPYIHGSLVVWNRVDDGGGRSIEMYDVEAETYVTVDDPTGLSVANPRMVLVYDQLHPNGDIVTRGYDMLAKKFIALDTLPRELPDELPESEPTSETRALIQIKPSVKGDEVVNDEVTTEDPPTEVGSGDSVDDLTLDLTVPLETSEASATSTNQVTLTDYDLIIEPYVATDAVSDGVQTSPQ